MKTNVLFSNFGEEIIGPKVIELKIYRDDRGFFFESWNQDQLNKILNQNINFVQDNHSYSKKGVLRGLHYQTEPNSQDKLVRCTKGEIFDVIVDLRAKSKTFGQWTSIKLNKANNLLWVPRGFAHGFLTLSSIAEVCYKVSNYWDAKTEKTIKWDDPDLSIDWPGRSSSFFLSEKDKSGSFINSLFKKDFY